jgi:hypothetical protein
MNNELKMMWNEVIVVQLRCYPNIWPKELGNAMERLRITSL